MKRWGRSLAAGAGIAGGIMAANRALRNAPLPVSALAGVRRPWRWRGHDIFVTEAGSGPPVVLVHGIYAGASAYEFRALFPLLARTHRVIALDLLGCGLSAKPPLSYTADLFVEHVADAVRELAGGPPAAVVGSSLGAAFAIRAAARLGDAVSRVAAICPTGLNGRLDRQRQDAPGAALTGLVRAPLVGEALWNALASKPSLAWFLKHEVYADRSRVTPELIDHYYAVTHQPGARYVTAAFIGGALDCDIGVDLPFFETPLLVLWGERAGRTSPRRNADEFVRLAHDARLVTFEHSGLLPHEEEPEAVASAIASFYPPG